MAKKFGKFFTLAVAAGTAAAAAYYYVQNKKKEAALAGAGFDADDFDDDDLSFDDPDFSDSDFDDDDFVDESDPFSYTASNPDSKVFTSGTNEQGHTYVTLDLNAAQDKASQFCGTVVNKLEEAVQKIKSTPEYETVTVRFNETADKIKNSEEAQAFGAAAA